MDSRILLAGQAPDIARSFAQGIDTARLANTAARENALARLYADQGAGIASGDPAAMNALAGIDPMAAMGAQSQQLGMDRTRQQMRHSEEDLKMAYAQANRQAQQMAATMSAQQRQEEAAKLERGLAALSIAQSPEQWAQIATQIGQPELAGQFDQKEMLIAQALGLKGALEMQQGPKPAQFGLQPVYGTDAQGNTVLMQLGNDGSAAMTRLPEGVRPDLGIASMERARGTEIGKQTATAELGVGSAIAKGQEALALIQSIASDPALPSITGMLQGRMPPVSQAGTDLNVKIEQLQGKVFLEAFESLKGGGAITEIEGIKAERAIARLNRAQSDSSYRQALTELAEVIASGMDRARSRAGSAQQGQPAPQAGPQTAPPPGTVLTFNPETGDFE
jgi:hypothetical protein